MKILYVGHFGPNQSEWSIKRGFESFGHTVVPFDFRTTAQKEGTTQADDMLITLFDVEKPDLVFFQKAKEVGVKVVKHCNETSKTFMWYMDALNNMDLAIEFKIGACHNVAYGLYEVYNLMKKNYNNSHFLNDGFDPEWDHPIIINYMYDVSFIGQPYGRRQEHLDMLGITATRGFYQELHSATVCATKINLCFTDSGPDLWGQNFWSARAYKIMACGAFLLVEKFPFMEKCGFQPGVHFATFDGTNDLLKQVDFYLKNENIREEIAKAGYKHVQNYSRYHLVEKILEIVNV